MGPPRPEKIYLSIEGVSEGTEVYSMGQLMGVAPGKIVMIKDAEPVSLIFKHEDFVSTSTMITINRDRSLRIEMKAKQKVKSLSKPPQRRKQRQIRRRDQLENPFE